MKEKILTLIGQLLFAASYMALGLMAFSCRYSNFDLLCVAFPFILIDTSSPIFKVKSDKHRLMWTFLNTFVLLLFINAITKTESDQVLFCVSLIFLLWGYFGTALLGQNKSVTIVAMYGMRVLLIAMPNVFPEMDWGVMQQSAVKDAVVVSILIDSLIGKFERNI